MANLKETSVWEPTIRQLETSDPVMGGENGVSNTAPRQLANRTFWLKTELANSIASINTGKANKATTLAGYGISDAYTQTATNNLLAGKANNTVTITGTSGLKGGGALSASQSLTIDKATATDLASGTSNKVITADVLQPKLDDKLGMSSPSAKGSITLQESTYPSVRLKPSTGDYGLVMESSGTQQYFAVRPVDTISSSVGQKALFAFPNKTGNYVLATTEDSLAFGNLGTSNLNNISRYGSYGQDQNVNGTTARNYPYQSAGRLDVSPGPYGVMQEYTTINGAKAVRYATASDLGTWGDWVKLSTLVQKLGDADNLNNIREYGVYGQDTTAKALASLNYPLLEAGTLEVKIGTYGLMQTYQTINGRFFLRRGQIGNTWSDWLETAQIAVKNLTSDDGVQPLAANQGKALKGLIDEKLPIAGPVASGSISIQEATYPSVRLKPSVGAYGLVMESSGTQHYFSVRPVNSINSAAGQKAAFIFPDKDGNQTFVVASDFAATQAANGYTKLPNGMILQWGLVSMPPNSSATVTLPIACNAIMQAMATYDLPTASEFPTLATGGFTTTTMTVAVKAASGANYGVRWFALCR